MFYAVIMFIIFYVSEFMPAEVADVTYLTHSYLYPLPFMGAAELWKR